MTSRTLQAALGAALALGLAAAPVLAAPPPAPDHGEPSSAHAVIDRQYADFLSEMPQVVSLLGLPGAEEAAHQLDDLSTGRRQVLRGRMQDYLAELQAIDRSRLTSQERLSLDSAAWMYARQLELTAPDWAVGWLPMSGMYAVDHLFGIPTTLVQFLTDQHAIRDAADAEAYLSRLHAAGRQLDQVIDNFDMQRSHGVLPPRASLQSLASQLRTLLEPAPADSVFVVSMARRMDAADDITSDARQELLARATVAVEASVQPGYSRLLARVEDALQAQGENHGVWALPGGDAFYDAALRWNTSTDLDADAIHALGLEEVARIEKRMDAILRAQGLEDGSVAGRVQALQADPAHTYSNDQSGRDAVIADIRAALDRIEPHLDQWFGRQPEAPLEVRPVPDHAQDSAPGGYYFPPALDGSRPGVFYINLGTMDHARWALPTLAYHEGAPGHHFQIALGQSLTGLPLIRRTLNPSAFTEGWALYVEQLAAEMGMYEDDPLGDLGRLQAEMFRAVRLVVDTGLHRQRWSRERAMEYMAAKTGLPANEVRIEIDRYLVQPGQASSYKIGHLRIAALRERAQQALGREFDIREFHDLLLGNGALPLAVAETAVEEWISSRR